MPMIRSVAYLKTVVLAMSTAAVPSLTPADKLAAPGHVDDAVFADGEQIVVLSSETSDPANGARRCFLSVWSIQQKKWLLTRPMDALPRALSCGGIEYLPSSRRLVITRAGVLLLLDAETLNAERTISVEPYNVVGVSEEDGTVYALSKPGYRPVTLAAFDLHTGSQAQQRELPGLDYSLGTSTEVKILSKNQVLFIQTEMRPITVPGRNSAVTLCAAQQDSLVCKTMRTAIPIASSRVSGDSLLLVSGDFADHGSKSRNQCIERLSLSTLQIDTQVYCRPDAGVHYSVAAIGNDFVLGYSGYGASWGWLDDGLLVNKSSSISIWEAKSARLMAIAPLPHEKSFTLPASVIRADTSGKKRFLFYNPTESREILLYDLSSLG